MWSHEWIDAEAPDIRRWKVRREGFEDLMSAVPFKRQGMSASWLGVGAMWMATGLLLNPWAIAGALEVERWGRTSSALIWGFDLLAITWGFVTIFYSSSDLVKNLNVLGVTFVVLLLSAEGALRIWPTILGQHFANGLMTKYSTRGDGIYYTDPVLRMNFMLPNYRAVMHYNGYTWMHQTDAYGFRNPETRTRADAILLGDSNIYGHGVDLDKTVGHFIQQLTGLTTANLARQGDSTFQQAYLLHEYIGRFAPRFVFYFFCENDISDVYSYQTDDEMHAFIRTPLSEITYPQRTNPADAIQSRDADNHRAKHAGSIIGQIEHRSYVVAVWKWVKSLRRDKEFARRIADAEHEITNPDSLGWQYTKHAISFMRRTAHQHGAEFVVVPIPPADKRLTAILERFARDQGIPFVDTDAMDRYNPATRQWYLAADHHFSGPGARTIAGLVAKYIDGCRASSSPECSRFALK